MSEAQLPLISGMFHAGITVLDMERSLRFYRDLLGLRVVSDRITREVYVRRIVGLEPDAIRIAFLEVPGSNSFIELLEYRGAQGRDVRALPADAGSAHTCLLTPAIDVVDRTLRDAGFSARSERPIAISAGPNVGALAVYFADPDGHWVEFLQRPALDENMR